MKATDLYDAGYRELVSVVPPKAELAPTTNLRPEARGKVPGIQRRDGRWVGYNFTQQETPDRTAVGRWEKDWKANVGLLAGKYPGLDIDCEDEQLVAFVMQEAQEMLGAAPVRTSREPRRLLVYRTKEPFTRIACKIGFKGQEHTVEMLGEGRQYLVMGQHPSGVDYGWEGKPLSEFPPDELALVTAEQVLALFVNLRDKLHGRATVTIVGGGEMAADLAPPQESLLAPNMIVLEEVVEKIPNEYPDREDYIRVGHAIKAASGEEVAQGLQIFWLWADKWEGGVNEQEVVRADWARMHPPYRVGFNWLQELASESGEYQPAVDEFEADPEAKPTKAVEPMGANDWWVVERLVPMLIPKLRYLPETGHWHVWNGYAWERDYRNVAEHLIRLALIQLSDRAKDRAYTLASDKPREKALKFAVNLRNRAALTKAVPELQSHPALTQRLVDFDADPWQLNTPEGIVNLRNGTIAPNDPAALLSKTTAVKVGGGAPTRWLAFLQEATGGDEDLQKFLQKQVGYALTGVTQEQTLSFVHGPPLTGKSVFIETLGGLFGSYHETAAADTFAAARGDRHPTDLAKLAGSRLVTASETQEGRSWDTQRIKAITGGDKIAARFMRQDFFEYKPTFKIIIVGNHEPEIKGVDEAMLRRLHIVPFVVHPEEVDRLLVDKLEHEWPDILAWAVEGCAMWLRDGLDPPQAVLLRTERYRDEEDPVGGFLAECCSFDDPTATTSRQDLYESWARWCHQQGETPGTLKQLRRRFANKLEEQRVEDARFMDGASKVHGYRGLALRTYAEEEAWH